jgi:hypothetical protein
MSRQLIYSAEYGAITICRSFQCFNKDQIRPRTTWVKGHSVGSYLKNVTADMRAVIHDNEDLLVKPPVQRSTLCDPRRLKHVPIRAIRIGSANDR